MKIFYLLTILFIRLLPSSNPDVTTQNVLYHSNKHSDKSTGLVTMDLNRLLVKGKTKLEWQDGHSTVKYAFDIKSVTGSLSLDKSGEVVYQVTTEKVNGRFMVKKTNATIRITAMLVAEGKPMSVDFEIAGYTIID